MHKDITIELCRELLSYNPETGTLIWKPRTSVQFNGKFAGREALTFISNGYKTGRINGKPVSAHRVGFGIYHGYFPNSDIDHINGNRSDNRIENLRAVDRSGNMKNASIPKDNTSGHIGVSWSSTRNKWCAYISSGKKRIPLGRFVNIEDAIKARKEAEIKYGHHENHGRLGIASP